MATKTVMIMATIMTAMRMTTTMITITVTIIITTIAFDREFDVYRGIGKLPRKSWLTVKLLSTQAHFLRLQKDKAFPEIQRKGGKYL